MLSLSYVSRRYAANRGGHAPGYLRDAFLEWIEEGYYIRYFTPDIESQSVEVGDSGIRPLRWLLGQLWNCTDVMPGVYCEMLDLERGSTYAMGVRSLRQELR
jgi:hypothetical protein